MENKIDIEEDKDILEDVLNYRSQIPTRCISIENEKKYFLKILFEINFTKIQERIWELWIEKIAPKIKTSG